MLLLLFFGLWPSPMPAADRSFTSVFNKLGLCQRPGGHLSMITVTTLYSIVSGINEGYKGRSGV
jgi:hypothetical protein